MNQLRISLNFIPVCFSVKPNINLYVIICVPLKMFLPFFFLAKITQFPNNTRQSTATLKSTSSNKLFFNFKNNQYNGYSLTTYVQNKIIKTQQTIGCIMGQPMQIQSTSQ